MKLHVNEIFHSIQGESTKSGLRFVFIRLSGCNLRCSYCDTRHSYSAGKLMTTKEILTAIKRFRCKNVLLTGGEPLQQQSSLDLVRQLLANDYKMSIETNGTIPLVLLRKFLKQTHIVMDIKTPSSMADKQMQWRRNLKSLKASDEIKIVLNSKADYLWAKKVVLSMRLPTNEIILSPTSNVPKRWLAKQIIKDKLTVRMQVQLHKIIWGKKRGV